MTKARSKLGAGRDQPSILSMLPSSSLVKSSTSREPSRNSSKASQEEEECVNTQTGSVSVAGSQSNTVNCGPKLGASSKDDVSLGAKTVATMSTSSHDVQASPEKYHTHTYPISHPWESSEAFAGMRQVADEVGPKKPKTGKSHEPRPAVEPLLGVVREVVGASKPVREGSASPKPVMEGGGSVNTHTGSVSVAGSQSNIVKAATDPVEPKDSLKSEAKPGGEQIYQGKNSGLGYPHVWWRGSGWKSSQGSKPSMGPDLDKSSSIPACVRPGENDSLRLTSDASLVAGPCPTYDVPGDNATMDKPSRSLADRSLGEKDSLAATSDASLVASLSPTSDVHGDDDSLGANSEVSLGGRGCVNTQTGSVSVAGSQSNIVYNVCSENVRKNVVQNISGLDDTKRMM